MNVVCPSLSSSSRISHALPRVAVRSHEAVGLLCGFIMLIMLSMITFMSRLTGRGTPIVYISILFLCFDFWQGERLHENRLGENRLLSLLSILGIGNLTTVLLPFFFTLITSLMCGWSASHMAPLCVMNMMYTVCLPLLSPGQFLGGQLVTWLCCVSL